MILVISTPTSGGSWICQKLLSDNNHVNLFNVTTDTNKNSVIKYVNSIPNSVIKYCATCYETQSDYDLLEELITSAEEVKVVVRRDFNAQVKNYHLKAYFETITDVERLENENTIFPFEDAEIVSIADWEVPYYSSIKYNEREFNVHRKLIHSAIDRQVNIVKKFDLFDSVLYLEDETDFMSADRPIVWSESVPSVETHLINLFDKNYVQD